MSTRRRGDSGAAAVEFALVSLLLFMLLFGIIGFGFGFYRKSSASHAAREGARLAAVGIGAPGAAVTDCSDFASEVIQRGTGANITHISVSFPDGNDVDGTVVVDVRHTISLRLIGAFVPGIPDDMTLEEHGKSRIERPSEGDADTGNGCEVDAP